MKIFIFEYLSDLTKGYHSGGGLVIIAASKKSAIKLLANNPEIKITEKDWEGVIQYQLKDNEENTPKFWVMPDGGCC